MDKITNIAKKGEVIASLKTQNLEFYKPEYAWMVTNLDSILIINGDVDQITLEAEIERIKYKHPILLKTIQCK